LAAGDADGDGELDLAIGAPHSFEGAGAVDLVSAHAGERVETGDDARAGETSGNFGIALAFAPESSSDVLLVGAPHLGRGYEGAVVAFRGATSGSVSLADRSALLDTTVVGAHAGTALATGCDVDGDREPDLLVGAWGDDSGATGGSAHLVRGPVSSRSLDHAYADFVSSVPGAAAGSGVLLADLDADGRCDVLIGAPGEHERAGAVYGFFAPAPGEHDLLEADFRIRGGTAGDSLGGALAAGDQDGDGVLDLWLGAPGHDEAGSESGAVYLVYGPPRGEIVLSSRQPRMLGLDADDHLGSALAAGHDLDGDGSHDVAIGAWGADAPGGNSGAVYVLRNVR
jgi:hypothetical protein